MKAPKEGDIVKGCLELLRLRHCLAVRINTTGIRRTDKSGKQFWTFNGTVGVSDIIGCLPDGTMLAVEVKMPGKKPTQEQLDFLEMVASKGGFAVWVDSVAGLDDELVKALGA